MHVCKVNGGAGRDAPVASRLIVSDATVWRRTAGFGSGLRRALTGVIVGALCGWGAVVAAPQLPAPSPADASPRLHVPSPDWRDQIIYFAMIDRFDDGEPRNNDQGAGEFDPRSGAHYSGGDMAGLARRLDYIQGLGATALWLTPPVAHQWWDGSIGYGGYHGYWGEHFKRVDAHFGSLEDYRALSHGLHSRGMYLVQDIVVNHVGNFFSFPDGWDASDPTRALRMNPDSRPHARPTQWPFSLNDGRRRRDRAASIYHWTPRITDYDDPVREQTGALADLDDLDTENPVVRRALRDSYGYWIREVGVDAFRVDTAFYVPAEYFRDFLHADDAKAPGVLRVAAATGREDFHVFGEGFGIDRAFEQTQARKIDAYMRAADGSALLPGMINFPLYGSTLDVFARGRPTAVLAHRIRSMMQLHARPHLMPSFVDNHDVDRFLAGGSEAGLKQALLLILTLPGIPVIYYGTEQGYTEARAAMFAGGFGAGGRDHFDREAPLYRYLARASALRRAHPVLSRGVPEVLDENAAAAGALAYTMRDGGDGALVVSNSAERETLVAGMASGLPPGTRLRGVFGIDDTPSALRVDDDGRLTLRLPARSGQVWVVEAASESVAESARGAAANANVVGAGTRMASRDAKETAGARAAAKGAGTETGTEPGAAKETASSARAAAKGAGTRKRAASAAARETPWLVVDPLPSARVEAALRVSGTARGVERFQLVVDGNLAGARSVIPDRDGRWHATLDTADFIDPQVGHAVVAWSDAPAAVSSPQRFHVDRRWHVLADVADAADDDHGPSGRYRYPTDPSWTAHRPLDIRRVRVLGSGGSLRIEVELRSLLASWNPPNGFDHLAVTLFLQLPGVDGGVRAMPLQLGSLPGDMRWHYRLRAGGWSNTLFAASGASATHEGAPVSPAADLRVQREQRVLSFTIPASALGSPRTLQGAKLYLTTWDYDGGYRALAKQPEGFVFGGGDRDGVRVMDDTAVVVLE